MAHLNHCVEKRIGWALLKVGNNRKLSEVCPPVDHTQVMKRKDFSPSARLETCALVDPHCEALGSIMDSPLVRIKT